MKLDPPLSWLFVRCKTICEPECCGIDAYHFHPAHIASFLLLYRGSPDPRQLADLRAQLAALKSNYGSEGASQRGATFEDINQTFSGPDLDTLVDTIAVNLDAAVALVGQYDSPHAHGSH